MQYGICNLSVVALRTEPSDTSEMRSQVLYGEFFKVLEQRKYWSKIRLDFDNCEGWLANNQYLEITETAFKELQFEPLMLSSDLVEFVNHNNTLITIPLGATLNGLKLLNHQHDGRTVFEIKPKTHLVETAFTFLNAPYLCGGKTPFGIDGAGFTQMVYKLNGYALLRNAAQQATQGEPLSFIEESEPGDLAFFDNADGDIVHVGIILKDNYIIHVHGKVRIDRIDHSGIYNADLRSHTHSLRVIKKII